MTSVPTGLKILESEQLEIAWSDGETRRYSFADLRRSCPCASCREKRKQPAESPAMLPVLSAAEAQPPGISSMKPVGNYAYTIEFSDGHDTGIFTFEFLKSLGSAHRE